jgi:hypothetical protein
MGKVAIATPLGEGVSYEPPTELAVDGLPLASTHGCCCMATLMS